MSEAEKDLFRLEHILEAIYMIEKFAHGVHSFEAFLDDELRRAAIERQLITIGEAVAHLSDDIKGISSYTMWVKIKGLRNILAHEYFAVDPVEVWGIVKNRIPTLKPIIENLIEHLKEENSGSTKR